MNTQQTQQYLRNVAEVDPCDATANRASQLAVDLEQPSKIENLTEEELALIDYARSKRHEYVLLPNAKHATKILGENLTDVK